MSSGGGTSNRFSLHKFYVRRPKAIILLRSTGLWQFTIASFTTTPDEFYEAITDAQAVAMWTASGLSAYNYGSFDCDDYSYVYKAQASRPPTRTRNTDTRSAFGASPTVGHAVNVFIDTDAKVRVIEPQNGNRCGCELEGPQRRAVYT